MWHICKVGRGRGCAVAGWQRRRAAVFARALECDKPRSSAKTSSSTEASFSMAAVEAAFAPRAGGRMQRGAPRSQRT